MSVINSVLLLRSVRQCSRTAKSAEATDADQNQACKAVVRYCVAYTIFNYIPCVARYARLRGFHAKYHGIVIAILNLELNRLASIRIFFNVSFIVLGYNGKFCLKRYG